MGSETDLHSNGYWHGFYDAVGEVKPSMVVFEAAAALGEPTHFQM